METTCASAVCDAVDEKLDLLLSTSDEIWNNPELAFEEYKASAILANALEGEGFAVQYPLDKSVPQLRTAFRATYGSGSPNVAFLCEFDALPEIGHACGHNLIAEAGFAAGIGLKSALERFSLPGTVTVLGTPAEESGHGKVFMIDAGYFKDVDFAMMVHPDNYDDLTPVSLVLKHLQATYFGKEAHAAKAPWTGVNALDAAVTAYHSISALRQQMKPTWRVHGVVKDGGTIPNVIPARAQLEYYIRTLTVEEMTILYAKVNACFEAAADATGCTVEVTELDPQVDGLISDPELAAAFAKHCQSLGYNSMTTAATGKLGGSTDMGNVSRVVPGIQPLYTIGPHPCHTEEFAALTNTPPAHRTTLLMAKAMALVGVDIMSGTIKLRKKKAVVNP